MRVFINFLEELSKMRKIPRRGWVLIGMKNPASIMDHSFRMAVMTWILGRGKKINLERAIKMALIHDLCEVYAGDITPYDYNSLPKNKKEWPKLFDSWPRFSKSKKIKNFLKKHKKEEAGLKKITSELPVALKKEMMGLWHDYEKGSTKEARFVRQINRLETLLQAVEYSEETKKRPYHSWWVGSEEHIDDSLLKEFMSEIGEKFYRKSKKKLKKK